MAFDITKPVLNGNPLPSTGNTTATFDILDSPGRPIEIVYSLSDHNRVYFSVNGLKVKRIPKNWDGINPVSQRLRIVDESGAQASASMWVDVTHTDSGRRRTKQTQIIFP